MNKILTIITLTFACVCFADDSVMVDNNGTLTYPDKATFAKKNAVNLSVFVDLYRDGLDDVSGMRLSDGGKSIYWSDCELKVLDKNGNIIYFFSTIYFIQNRFKLCMTVNITIPVQLFITTFRVEIRLMAYV